MGAEWPLAGTRGTAGGRAGSAEEGVHVGLVGAQGEAQGVRAVLEFAIGGEPLGQVGCAERLDQLAHGAELHGGAYRGDGPVRGDHDRVGPGTARVPTELPQHIQSAAVRQENVEQQSLAAKKGLKTSDFHRIGVGAGSTAIAALQNGTVACLMTTQPTVAAIEKEGVGLSAVDLAGTEGATAAMGDACPAASALARTDWVNSQCRRRSCRTSW